MLTLKFIKAGLIDLSGFILWEVVLADVCNIVYVVAGFFAVGHFIVRKILVSVGLGQIRLD